MAVNGTPDWYYAALTVIRKREAQLLPPASQHLISLCQSSFSKVPYDPSI